MRNILFILALLPDLAFANDLLARGLPDPSGAIRITKLNNGIPVVLAPSEAAKTVQIRMKVNAGFEQEEKGAAGTAHLLEHYLFKDAKMDANMTYLEKIKENGGTANAFTSKDSTVYYATVPSDKVVWAIETFGRILIKKDFQEADVQQAKGPVFLEIGRPGPMDYFVVMQGRMWPKIARTPDFWESEFGVQQIGFIFLEDRITTAGLTASDLKHFYDKYYHSGNIEIYLSGNFSGAEVASKVAEVFDVLPAVQPNGNRIPDPVNPRMKNYFRSTATSQTPWVNLGTKVVNANVQDEVILEMYLGHLAHRLMKEVRNVKGETYTASPSVAMQKGYGYASIHMQLPVDEYYPNAKKLRDMMDAEARSGGVSEGLFKEARSLYGAKFALQDRDAYTMMDLALEKYAIMKEYPNAAPDTTFFKEFTAIDYPTYKARLQALFAPNMKMEVLQEPPLLFRYEETVLAIGSFALWLNLIGIFFTKRFAHGRIRWMRKLRYPPAYLMQIFVTMFAVTVAGFLSALLKAQWSRTDLVQNTFIVSEYLFGTLNLGICLVVFQAVLGLTPRKVTVADGKIFVKSLGLRSRVFNLADVERVELCRPWLIFFSPRLWWSTKYRYYSLDPWLWRQGVLVYMTGGRTAFFGVTNPKSAVEELRSFLTPAIPMPEIVSVAEAIEEVVEEQPDEQQAA